MTSTNNQATKPASGSNGAAELVVYRASAGSGKTFTLAVEYIALLMKNPDAYRNILAVTFTNKATAEMKERILSQLYGISKGLPDSNDYLAAINGKTGLSEADIRRLAGEALNHIIHDYSRFHVETLDTFSVSVMRNLAKELNVGTDMNIELKSDDVLSDAVDTMIEGLSQGTDVLNWLTNYIMESIEDDKSWKMVFKNVKDFGGQIFNEQFVEKGDKLREQLKNPKSIKQYKKTLIEEKEKIKELLKQKGDEFFKKYNDSGIPKSEFDGRHLNTAIGYAEKLQKGNIDKIEISKTLSGMLKKPEDWTKDKAKERERVIELAESDLMRILKEAEEQRRLYNSCCLSLQHINELRLLAEIGEQMERLNQMNNRYLLAEVNKLLRGMIKDSDTPFVFEKLGTTFSNIMMDEFQDTSCMQWQNFKALIKEGLSNGNDSLIVGDVKQSIYRWRNGDWKILNDLRDKFEDIYDVREKTAEPDYKDNKNYRSAKNIVTFNNAFFEAAKDNLAERCKGMDIDDADLRTAYENVAQTSNKTAECGYVKVTIQPYGAKDEHYQPCTLDDLVETITQLRAGKVDDKDIAILVRNNDKIKKIAERFSEKGIKLVSDEAFRLDASVAVNIIVNALRCLSVPNLRDKKSKSLLAPLAIDYQHPTEPKCNDIDEILRLTAGEILDLHLPEAFSAHTDELRQLPLCELVERLYAIFYRDSIPEQDGYLCAFFDSVSDYSSTHPSELADFVAYWDETLFKKTIPVGEVDGIRILTIHKAKGLEYNTVLVPFCDWELHSTGIKADNIWCEPGEDPFDGLPLLPIKYQDDMETSIYKEDFREEKLRQCVDNLNLLYVAFTRAKENLFVWTHKPSDDAKSKGWNITHVLRDNLETLKDKHEVQSLPASDPKTDPTVYERGMLQEPQHKEEDKKPEANILLVKPEPEKLEMRPMKGIYKFKQSNRSTAFISGRSEAQDYIDRGNLLHDFFSRISTTADVRSAAEQLVEEGLIADDKEQTKVSGLTDFALRALSGIQDHHWFDGSWRLFNECAIIYKEGGKIETRRPDRVMMKDGAVVVLDYKFAQKETDHNKQVIHYMNLMKRMGHQNVKGYLWYFDLNNNTNELEEVNNG